MAVQPLPLEILRNVKKMNAALSHLRLLATDGQATTLKFVQRIKIRLVNFLLASSHPSIFWTFLLWQSDHYKLLSTVATNFFVRHSDLSLDLAVHSFC